MNNPDFSSQSDFHNAALYGDTMKLIKEMEKGVNAKSLNSYKRSALHNAAIGGQISIAQLLLVDPAIAEVINWPDVDGNTCVHLAALHGRKDCMALFVDNGADFTKPNAAGLFPVHLAAKRGHWELLKLLYDRGIRLDTKCQALERTAIHYAAESGADAVVRGLVTLNAVDMADIDVSGNLTTHCAAMGNQLKVLKYLIEQGIHVDRNPNRLGRYPLHYAAAANAITVVHWICENVRGSHVNIQDNDGNSPAHMAGLYGAAQVFNCLSTHGSDLSLLNNNHETPIESARRAGHPFLIDKAINNQVECPDCKKVRDEKAWRAEHPIPSVMQKIAADQLRVFRVRGKKDALFRPIGDLHQPSTNAVFPPSSSNGSRYSVLSGSRNDNRRVPSATMNGNRHKAQSISGKAPPTSSSSSSMAPNIKSSFQDNGKELVAIGRDLPTKFYGEHIDRTIYKLQ